jgi:hypothetical protein
MFAILDDAVQCWCTNTTTLGLLPVRRERLRQEASRWIFGHEASSVTFETACTALNIEPDWLRAELLRVEAA